MIIKKINIKKSILVFLLGSALLFVFQSCKSSESGGSTAGNPLDSSLPQQISVDAQ